MQITIDKTYQLPVGPAPAWAALQDIHNLAGCMPGAEITEQIDAQHYKGRVKVKVGPVAVAFNGNIEVQESVAEERRLHVVGKGGDGRGSSATLDLRASIAEADDGAGGAALIGNATVTVNGQIVSLAGRMLKQVADQLLDQFGSNFTTLLQSAQEESVPEPPAATDVKALPLLWGLIVAWCKRLVAREPGP